MSLSDKFNAAATSVRNIKTRPTDAELLELYALYKQATAGDCSTSEPNAADAEAKAKWAAWNAKKGLNQDAAKEAYVTHANKIITAYWSQRATMFIYLTDGS